MQQCKAEAEQDCDFTKTMQAVHALSSRQLAEISGKFANDFMGKLKIDDENVKIDDKYNDEEVGEDEDEDHEFSFVFANPEGLLISADDVFDNGKIRPVFPIFDQNLLFAEEYDGVSDLRPQLKKVFVEQPNDSPSTSSAVQSESLDGSPEGPYCEWSGKTAVKSNSTGFSKLWRFRDMKLRSNSDGKDAFVFLNPSTAASGAKPGSATAEVEKSENLSKTRSGEVKNAVVKKVVKAGKGKTAPSAHEKHYMMNRAKKDNDKRKSYLPYRPELVGFFANVNGMSRNVHPF